MSLSDYSPCTFDPERPSPIELPSDVIGVQKKSDFRHVATELLSGSSFTITDAYPTGLRVLHELKTIVFGNTKKNNKDYNTYRDKRFEYKSASEKLLIPISDHKIALKKSPEIGWLARLYSDTPSFALPFPVVQGLNSSWQWYIKGIKYPVLDHMLHPWYGTYFPTRHDHLLLFEKWLNKYKGSKLSALDIGTGCGVLSFQLLKHGFSHITATDINTNALISVCEDAHRLNVEKQFRIIQSDLFDRCEDQTDLIVFNPPWLPSHHILSSLDKAIFYPDQLFERFFDRAGSFLTSEGKILLFFSNIGNKEGLSASHPVKEELSHNKRYRLLNRYKRKVRHPSHKTRRRNNRISEYVELWELEKL